MYQGSKIRLFFYSQNDLYGSVSFSHVLQSLSQTSPHLLLCLDHFRTEFYRAADLLCLRCLCNKHFHRT